jgi:tubulin polyglutamylase TTLL4
MSVSKSVPLPADAPAHFYPQSLSACQPNLMEDCDVLTPLTTYMLRPSERLEVGKYVPDPQGKDPSNPKYVPTALSESNSLCLEPSDIVDDDADYETDGPAAAKEQDSLQDPFGLATYKLIRPADALSAKMSGSIFFPVHYGAPSHKDRQDPRGLPQAINNTLHPNDRESTVCDTYGVKAVNLNKLALFKIGPGAVAFRVVINAFEAGGLKYTPSNKYFNILWAKRATPAILGALQPYQKVNHFPGTWGIGRKDSLAVNIGKMKRQYGAAAFNIVPASFVLPKERDELAADLQEATEGGASPPTYIVKPSASSCGRGIKLYRGMPPMPKGPKTAVCQRYIGNPFLVGGRKFDLRMYCVVTGFDPLRIFLFDEGLVRFAAEKYPGPDRGLDNTYMHLTNYSVSKTAELSKASRGKDEETDDPVDIKWCISDFKAFLATNHGADKAQAMWSKILAEVHDVIIKMFLSIEAEVVTRLRSECSDPTGRNCFELYGLDLMVDDTLNVKLIEVNIMPSLATGATLDKAVKGRMLAHMLTLARPIPYVRNRNGAIDEAQFVPAGAFVAGAASERYYYPGVRGAPRGAVERNNISLLTRFNNPQVKESMLSPREWLMLSEADEELRCAGGFAPVYPVAGVSQKYFPYFTQGVSRNNYLLASWTEMRDRAKR